jgi:hypothetical protein
MPKLLSNSSKGWFTIFADVPRACSERWIRVSNLVLGKRGAMDALMVFDAPSVFMDYFSK